MIENGVSVCITSSFVPVDTLVRFQNDTFLPRRLHLNNKFSKFLLFETGFKVFFFSSLLDCFRAVFRQKRHQKGCVLKQKRLTVDKKTSRRQNCLWQSISRKSRTRVAFF